MTRLQKQCMFFSLGLHGLLAVILLASAGFGTRPRQPELQLLTMLPANIVDRAGAGGGTPMVNLAPQHQAPAPAQARPQPPAARAEAVERAPQPTPKPRREITRPEPEPEKSEEIGLEPRRKPKRKRTEHEVHVSYTLASSATSAKRSTTRPSSESSSRAENRRLKEIANSLDELAQGVRTSGSPNTIVDTEGIGGGEAFAGYRDVVASYYYRAWITPDNSSSRLAAPEARVTIARDGSIISAELSRPSGDRSLDRSVERALQDVTKLPPFPASTRETQRTYVIRFNLEAKEMSG
jgi:TonB family protein